MKFKFISKNQVKRANNPIYEGGQVYSNPTDETLRALGYKELVIEEQPEVPEDKIAIPVFIDGDVITQSWEIVDNEFA